MENTTYNNDGIECPYCGYVEDDSEVKYDIEEEELKKFDCPHCQKSMNVSQIVLHSWETSQRTKEWLEEDINRLQRNLARAKEQNRTCESLFTQYENEIRELKEELKQLNNNND